MIFNPNEKQVPCPLCGIDIDLETRKYLFHTKGRGPASQLRGEKLCKDHIIPICLGGSDSIENIQPICRNCNTAKTNEQIDYRPKAWKKRLTNAQPIVNSSSSSSSSSSSAKKREKENIKRKTFTPTEIRQFEEQFDNLWTTWPADSRAKKKYCRMKFMALCKAGKHPEFKMITRKYSDYLRYKRDVENFDQRCMHLSTWLNNWEEDKEKYINFEYKERL